MIETASEEIPEGELVEALAEAVLVVDPALGVRYLNATAEDLLGASRRRAVGAALGELVAAEPEWWQHAQSAIRRQEAYTAREIRLTPLGGTQRQPFHADVSAVPWHAPRWGPVVVFELSPLDRHLRIAREEALRAQEQANRVLLRGLAHEIRNPLAGLRGAAQLLERELEAPQLADYTRVIVREADRLRELVERMMGPAQAPQPAPLNIHETTEHVMQLLRAEAAQGVTLATEYDPSIPELIADHDQLVQALLNLGRNALQAVGAQGRVSLRTRTLRQHTIGQTIHRLVVVIEVADDGPGIPSELQDTLFQPLISGRTGGSGLGLTIAQSLVSRQGGLIECDTSATGTTFRAILPLENGDGR